MRSLIALLAATPLAAAIHLRVGGTKSGTVKWEPAFHVYSDDWSSHKGSWHTSGLGINARLPYTTGGSGWDPHINPPVQFCDPSPASCPFQVDNIAGYGFRVIKNGGNDHAIEVQSWHTKDGKVLTRDNWCWYIGTGVWEGNDQMFWQCDFTGY